MKKNIERTALVAMAIVLAATGYSVQASAARPVVSTGTGQVGPAAQRPAAKDRIEIPFPSKVGDRARYALTYTANDHSLEATALTDVTVEISGADESRFLITWTYGEWHSSEPGLEADLDSRRILNLMRRVRLLLKADPRTIPTTLKLTNWEALRAQLAEGREEIRRQMRADGISKQEADLLEAIEGLIPRNRDDMTAYYTQAAVLFFSLLGQRIPVSDSPEYEVELANPLGGDPLPARGRISVKSYDPVNHRAVLLDTMVLDPSRTAGIFDKISRDHVAKLAPRLFSDVPEGSLIKSLSAAGQTELDLDLESGWPESLTYKISMTLEMAPPGEGSVKRAREEIFSMKRIQGDVRPDIMGATAKWQALFKEAQDLSRQGQNERALEAGEKALQLAELNLGPDHPDLAPVLDAVAEFYLKDDLSQDAGPLWERALAIREKALGPDHPEVEKALNSLADFYESRGFEAEAVTIYERILAIREKALGPGHPQVAATLDKLARFRYYQRQYPEAESLWRRSLAIREKALGPDRPEVAANLQDLAMLFQVQGQYAAAEPLWKRALAIREKTLGPNHPDLAMTLSMLAELYRATNRPKEAEVLESRASRILKR